MRINSKFWIIGWLAIFGVGVVIIGTPIAKIDPYMHYHKPLVDKYFYVLNNQRYQNDGITKHFEYDILITGTSMTENFRTSEVDALFNCKSVKVPYPGGSYKEINDNIKVAIKNNSDLKVVIRGLDMNRFWEDTRGNQAVSGTYPKYLYDCNPINDIQYICNRDILWNRVYPMTKATEHDDFKAGITSFDDYSRWQEACVFGSKSVFPDGIPKVTKGQAINLSQKEKRILYETITKNVTSVAADNPQITFYYFFTPYSVAYWLEELETGNIYKQLQAEECVIELILEHENIKLFSFNNITDITCDLDNYKDSLHYADWVNSQILEMMYNGECQLTTENYKSYLESEKAIYLNIDGTMLGE